MYASTALATYSRKKRRREAMALARPSPQQMLQLAVHNLDNSLPAVDGTMYLPYRIRGKRIGYTMAALYRDELKHADIKDLAVRVGQHFGVTLREYSVGFERHQFANFPQREWHFHGYFMYSGPITINDRRFTTLFDLHGFGGRPLHPELQCIGTQPNDRWRYINYTGKEGPVLQQLLCEGDPQHPLGSNAPQWSRLAVEAETVADAMNAVLVSAPHEYALHYDRLRRNLTTLIGRDDSSDYTMDDFKFGPLPLDLPAVLEGAPGCGKTEFALAHFAHPLLVVNIEDLRKIAVRTDGLVFDDMTFDTWTPSAVLSFLSIKKNRSVKARYADIDLARNIPMIFTTNVIARLFPTGRSPAECRALQRRYRVFSVTAPLFDE